MPTLQNDGMTKSNESLPSSMETLSRRSSRISIDKCSRRSPSPEKKEKKSMPLSLRVNGPNLTRQSSSESNGMPVSIAAVEASRAATLAWHAKKQNGICDSKPIRKPSPASFRGNYVDSSRRQGTEGSFWDAPLIDFSTQIPDHSSSLTPLCDPNVHSPSISRSLPTPSLPQRPETQPSPTRRVPPSRHLSRSNATLTKPQVQRQTSHPRSSSVPDIFGVIDNNKDLPPIVVSLSNEVDRVSEEDLSREEKALKGLKGVDEALAKTILNDIIVRGDQVQWDDIGILSVLLG